MTIETVSRARSFDGELAVFDHRSAACQCTMRYGVYTPPQARSGPVPVLWYLSGLTCNWSNVMEKGGIQRAAAAHGIMVIAPDTSPRGESVADVEAYDLGQGAGFYLDATQKPWAPHFAMERYVTDELPKVIAGQFPDADTTRQGITGHSMGGHGALTLHLRHQARYRSVSAFAPIVAPTQVPWGQKAFTAYLGDDQSAWSAHDACALVGKGASDAKILIDQGMADGFLEEQLRPDLFEQSCAKAGQALTLNRREGYDHSYYFIASFMDTHMAHHAAALKA